MNGPSDFDGYEEIDDGEDDEQADAALNCGLMVEADGREICMNAGTEWCDWDCPYSADAHRKERARRTPKPGPLLQIMEPK